MSEILTSQEMLNVYKRLETEGRAGEPYVLMYESGDSILTFFGSVHSSDPESLQWSELESEWSKFMGHDNPKRLLLFEKAGTDIGGLSREEAITRHGETGLALWLANKSGVEAKSPQVDRLEAIQDLQQQGFSTKDIITYYFARQMHQWARQDRQIHPDWQAYMQDTISHYNDLDCWGEKLSLDNVLLWFKDKTGKEFDENDTQIFYDLSDPTQNPVSEASGLQQDLSLNNAIIEGMNQDKDVFVVYGSSHAIRLEPVLDATFIKEEEE